MTDNNAAVVHGSLGFLLWVKACLLGDMGCAGFDSTVAFVLRTLQVWTSLLEGMRVGYDMAATFGALFRMVLP